MSVPIANIMEPADWQDREMERLEDENAKLCELVQELYEDQCADGDQWKYRDRMRELGVQP